MFVCSVLAFLVTFASCRDNGFSAASVRRINITSANNQTNNSDSRESLTVQIGKIDQIDFSTYGINQMAQVEIDLCENYQINEVGHLLQRLASILGGSVLNYRPFDGDWIVYEFPLLDGGITHPWYAIEVAANDFNVNTIRGTRYLSIGVVVQENHVRYKNSELTCNKLTEMIDEICDKQKIDSTIVQFFITDQSRFSTINEFLKMIKRKKWHYVLSLAKNV